MRTKIVVKKNLFFDSVSLMQLSDKVKSLQNILEVVILMATDTNKYLLKDIDLYEKELDNSTPNDLIIAIKAEDDESLKRAFDYIEVSLTQKSITNSSQSEPAIVIQEYAYRVHPDINLVLISTPGEYAALEAKKALLSNKHVMIFSDNVKLEDEIELKDLALSRDMLLMGPDCGTAMINHIPLGFANEVPAGPIGIIAASGSGSQEVASLIAKLGSGITQLIGVGGRDLNEQVGGKMMLQALQSLNNDPKTKVIVLISKPPAKNVAEKILNEATKVNKPVVICFLGADNSLQESRNLHFVKFLEDAALKAVELVTGKKTIYTRFNIYELAKIESAKLNENQKYIRGLYAGGTLCDEAIIYLSQEFNTIYSNIHFDNKYKLSDNKISIKDTLLDLGDDEFTRGKAHPMIDPQYRNIRLLNESDDPDVAIVLLDFVLGYGAHPDPAGVAIGIIQKAKEKFMKRNQHLIVIASITGTENDPQILSQQQKKLEDAGVICMPSNLQAVKLAALIKKELIQ